MWAKWSASYSQPPLGHVLRTAFKDRWVRVHNLPGGKRGFSEEGEKDEVLRRNNTVASSVLGIGSECVAWLTHYGSEAPLGTWRAAGKPPKWDSDESLAEELLEATFYFQVLAWSPHRLDDVILLAADGDLGPLTVLSLSTHGIYCPYHGGADLILPSSQYVASTKRLFAGWLSDLPSGL